MSLNLIAGWTLGIAMGVMLIDAGAIDPTPETGFGIAIFAALLMMAHELVTVGDTGY